MKGISELVNSVISEIGTLRPILVHCSAGCGRTGTLIGILNAIASINELKKIGKAKSDSGYDLTPRISVFSIVRRLREQRWAMVKTQLQYQSIYEFLAYYYSLFSKA